MSHEVLARMKQLMVDNNTAASHSFLLDDDSSIPFSLDDIAALMEDKARPAPATICFEEDMRACVPSQHCVALHHFRKVADTAAWQRHRTCRTLNQPTPADMGCRCGNAGHVHADPGASEPEGV